jgi:hypothetical protein
MCHSLSDEGFTMISKPKSTKAQAKSNGRHVAKAVKTQPKADGRHELKSAGKMEPKSNGHAGRHAAATAPHKAGVQRPERTLEKFRGLLQDFNFSPKGGVEGFLLHADGQTVQINVTPDVGFAVVRGIGQTVEATVEPDHEAGKHAKGDHPVYHLVMLTGTEGKVLIHSGAGNAETVTVQGVVKRINYAPHGAANGVVLESGDFIHMKPEGMKKIDLKAGDQVTAEGQGGTMPLGQQVVEARTVNGTSIVGKKPGRRG